MSNISFILFSYNEEKRVSNAVKNFIKYGDVYIMDGGSTDKTKEIAESLGAKFIVRPETGLAYVENKQVADCVFNTIKTDWIYWGYMDNMAPKSLLEKFIEISKQDKIKYVTVPLFTYLWGNIDHVSNISRSPMFFRKGFVDFKDNHIHGMGNFIGQEDEILHLPRKKEFAIKHFSLYDMNKFVLSHLNYAKAEAEQKFKDGKKFSLFYFFGAMLRYFWMYYRYGYKNGKSGLVVSFLYVFFRVMVYSRLYELENNITLGSIEDLYNQEREQILKNI